MNSFTLASFNAHWGVTRFGDARGTRFDVAALVRGFDAEVVVVAEAWRGDDGVGVLDSLESDFHIERVEFMKLVLRHDRSGVRDQAPREGTWELAICSKFPLRDVRHLPMKRVHGDPVPLRHALAVGFEVGGHPVELVGLHTSSRVHELAPVRHLLSVSRQLHADRPQIVAGDFNFWGPPIGLLMRGWHRPVRGRSYPAHRPHSQIDHILVRGGIAATDGEVLAETPSDHRPVRARLRIG